MKTSDKIINASLQLFNEHGERSTTTNHIAAHLGMSPGNLYYHFKNKDDIIRSIFSLYESYLDAGFQPYQTKTVNVELLVGYFDTMFEILWRFRFMYTNLTDILSRDTELLQRYLTIQQNALQRSSRILLKLKHDGMLRIDDDKVHPLADTMRMIACFWIGYKQTHSANIEITKSSLYEGLLRVIMIFKLHATSDSLATFDRLESHYQTLANAELATDYTC
ncbi:TetR/AcrR family transcriptional regulator [Shewanella gelidii]|uniref:TetR family transcriptional regulator n=1 Tax=Shewanella gelidii TaxID=1642821 RepID=A0A917JQA7_9GAMM|nr:TetR/AcrR family transcriptional regulator [Shewanella gelidii]MCL1099171.1 TetR/AcrR family transcriptional regulator [Shewanella gelidii]GGI81154.1 TetR family transcriptional regulator [Shewanella gelidii]